MKCPRCNDPELRYAHRNLLERYLYIVRPVSCANCGTRFWVKRKHFWKSQDFVVTILSILGFFVFLGIILLFTKQHAAIPASDIPEVRILKGNSSSASGNKSFHIDELEEILTNTKSPEPDVLLSEISSTQESVPLSEASVNISILPDNSESEISTEKNGPPTKMNNETRLTATPYPPMVSERNSPLNAIQSLQIDGDEKNTNITLQSKAAIPYYDSFFLYSPLRFVLDLSDTWQKVNEPIQSVNNENIQSVRFGNYKNKLRIVFDFLREDEPQVRIDKKNTVLSIYFHFSERASGNLVTPETKQADMKSSQQKMDHDSKYGVVPVDKKPSTTASFKDESSNGQNPSLMTSINHLQAILQTVTEDSIDICIRTQQAMQDYSFFTAEEPPRLVLDLKGRWTTEVPKTIISKNPRIMKSIRMGSHADHLRIVFDLSSSRINHVMSPPETECMLHINLSEEEKTNFAMAND